MNASTPNRFLTTLTLTGAAALVLTSCATRPPREVGPPSTPVMPPPPQRQQSTGVDTSLPPPPVVDFGPEVQPLPTPAPVSVLPPAPMPRPAPAPRPGTPYTVKNGESLSAIAARHKINWVKLAEYNRIADPNKVRVGQTLLIPPSASSAPAAPTYGSSRPAPLPPPANTGNTYVVQSGDNLTTIARRYNTTVSQLKSANSLRTDRLLVGQILKLPTGSASAPTAPQPRPTAAPTTISRPTPTPAPMRPVPTPVPTLAPELIEISTELPPAETAVEDPMVDKPFTIVVMEGDTLESIAANYVVSVEKIRELNNLPAGATLNPGQRLEMPTGVY